MSCSFSLGNPQPHCPGIVQPVGVQSVGDVEESISNVAHCKICCLQISYACWQCFHNCAALLLLCCVQVCTLQLLVSDKKVVIWLVGDMSGQYQRHVF